MEEYHTGDCGNGRDYTFRNIRSPKIRFSVKAKRDAALCLTHHKINSPDDSYEIFIGCWGGDESGIRRGKTEDVLRVETKDILSDQEYRSFWIMLSRGVLKVGKKGKSRPFMIFEDPDHLQDLNYYGYCTGWGAEGDWMFDDERDDSSSSSSDASSSDSEAEELENLDDRPIMYKRPARWVLGTGGHLPRHPVSGGTGADGDIYVGMAKHEGGHILGIVVQSEKTCYIPYGGESISKENYYVLGNPNGVSLDWKPASCGTVPPGALEGGKSEDGEPLFIGRVCVDGVISCGKVHPSHGAIYVPYGGAEHAHRDYEVLCVTGLPCRFRI